MMPMTSYRSSLIDIVRPIASGLPPKRRCHRPWLMTTTLTPLLSSSSVKTRPAVGLTPRTLQNVQEALRAGTCSGSPSPDTVASTDWVMARSVKTVLSRRHSSHSAGDGVSLVVMSSLVMSSQIITSRSASA